MGKLLTQASLSYKKKNLIPIQYEEKKKKKFIIIIKNDHTKERKEETPTCIDLYEKLFLERIETLVPITVTSIV